MIKSCSRLWLSVLFSVFCGCSVGPRYHRPPLHPPESFRGEKEGITNSIGDLPWSEVFLDEHLQTLIRIALTNNYDLRIATARVEQARAQAAQARSQLLPQVNYGAIAGRGQNVSAGNTPSPTGTSGAIFAADANVSWEIDLFGRLRRLNEAARAQYFASREARHDVTISLIAQVAQSYFTLLALDSQVHIAYESTNSFGQSLKIFNQRLQGGIASKLETASAAALMNSAAATIPELDRQLAAQENQAQQILLGKNPGAIERSASPFQNPELMTVPAGLPSSLLERRPDIRQAEQQLRAANAQLGVAVADFFPQLNLTGLLGRVSPEVSAFTGGGDLAWSVAAGLTGPIFHGGQLRAFYDQASAARQEAALRYHAT